MIRVLWAVLAATMIAPATASAGATVQSILASRVHPALAHADLSDTADDLNALYAADDRLLWVADRAPTPQAKAVAQILAQSGERGLRPADYEAEWITANLGGSSLADPESFDVGFSATVLRFLRHLISGRIDPRRVGFALETAQEPVDLAAVVTRLSRTNDAAADVADLDPPFPLYRRLQAALPRYREMASAAPEWKALSLEAKLVPGESNSIVPRIRERLVALGDMPAPAKPPKGSTYDASLQAGVRAFQRRHGLQEDAVIGKGTLAALNISPEHRVHQIELAMERLRWLPRTRPDRFVIVNIPEFKLSAFDATTDGPALTSNVVVGSAARKNETPILAAEMQFVVFRPYWNVPPGIRKGEIGPKVARDPEYLERNDMEIKGTRIRQRPGANNSLGLVKFVMPNRHHVYLHDTPAKDLFRRTRRDFSHGCIRVAKAAELAEFVLAPQGWWNAERIQDAMRNGKNNRHIEIKQPVPVFLLYSTAIAGRDGEVRFFEDIYGHDAELAEVLGLP